MRQCPQCHREQQSDDTNFCIFCGASLAGAAPQGPAQQGAAPGGAYPPAGQAVTPGGAYPPAGQAQASGGPVPPAAPPQYDTRQYPPQPYQQPAPGQYPPQGGYPPQQPGGYPPQQPGGPPPPKKGSGKVVAIIVGAVVVIVALVVLLVMLFTRGKDAEVDESESRSRISQPRDEASSEAQAESDSSETDGAQLYGVFECNPEYPQEYRPKFVLREDGSFAGHANLLEGMGYCAGHYVVNGDRIEVTVTEADFFSPGEPDPWNMGWYMGAEYGIFEIVDDDTLRIVEPDAFLGDTPIGTVFTRSSQSDVMPIERGVYEPFDGQEAYVDAEGGLNLRDGPGTGHKSLVLIPEGDTVVAVGDDHVYGATEEDTWYYVEYKGKTGWVNGEYVLWYSV